MLTPKKKLTKKELKHDPLLDTLEKGKEFYEENSKQIMTGAIAVVAVIILGWGWMNNQAATRNEAMLANTKATLAAVGGVDDNVLAELERVVDQYGDNSVISQATYQLGVARLDADDLSGARDLFTVLANSSDKQLKVAGKLKLAFINEKEANYGDAASLYSEVGAMGAGIVSEYATLQAGYAYVSAGNVVQAENIVAELLSEKPTGKFLEQVKYLEGKVLEK
ncbi:MAG: tetratricopeptide repeat protein [Candidatus Marinimicrobia bacterium]|jgi:predicted negative regulator of RcsB-dependent stress response|nr:tetratricopeptide repeat protein [Candidatus Neomarinimicrobiota bacterium]MBT3825059.1 tetratricopeptide repeat protein [Candidatus Neomarinimicrobiota bacterium]MBT4131402.1 tetratricopeptide repeat protein [Candidatus Neomarinimicrobiota bacterium]MBT4296881.1 tetratricopeptide repeat protein [Candidatus Neomarinimicrobiota bacterium]MBT4421508.1 tetratricopeptide repeat protein [Candidatus Neomarinimicrobiota bacterium]